MEFWLKEPPEQFFAVIFISLKKEITQEYQKMDALTMQSAGEINGFLGYASVSNETKNIFISYWETLQSIEKWKHHPIHTEAKSNAYKWYLYYHSMICKVEKSAIFDPTKLNPKKWKHL